MTHYEFSSRIFFGISIPMNVLWLSRQKYFNFCEVNFSFCFKKLYKIHSSDFLDL